MRDNGLKITGHTYTGLFNSLANSPFSEEALARAHRLRATLQERGVLMNQIIYHSMIKGQSSCTAAANSSRICFKFQCLGILTVYSQFILNSLLLALSDLLLAAIAREKQDRHQQLQVPSPLVTFYRHHVATLFLHTGCIVGFPQASES